MTTKARKRKKPEAEVDAEALGEQAATQPETLGLDPQPIQAEGGPVDQVIEAAEAAEPAPPPDSPERLAEWDAETRRLLSECALDVEQCQADHEAKKEAATSAKHMLELAWKALHKTVRDREAGRGKPIQKDLFDKTDGHAAAQDDPRTPAEVLAAGPGEDDGWKAEPVHVLVLKCGLKPKIADRLTADHGLDTLGKLSAYTEPSASGWVNKYDDLKGIGAKGAEQITDAFAKFWELWPEIKAANETPTLGTAEGGAAGGHESNGQPAGAKPAGYRTDASERLKGRQAAE